MDVSSKILHEQKRVVRASVAQFIAQDHNMRSAVRSERAEYCKRSLGVPVVKDAVTRSD